MKNKSIFFVTMAIIFLAFLGLMMSTEEEGNYYKDYRDYIYAPSATYHVVEQFDSSLFDMKNIDWEAYITGDSWQLSYALLSNNGGVLKPRMIRGDFFSKNNTDKVAVLGKEAYEMLSTNEKAQQKVNFDQQQIPIIGVLAESPFNTSVLLNGKNVEMRGKYLPTTDHLSLRATNGGLITTFENKFLKDYITNEAFIKLDTMTPQASDFTINAARFKNFYYQLILFSIFSIGIQLYQRIENWRLELAIRKLAGASPIRLVLDTFLKYFRSISLSFIVSLVIFTGFLFLTKGPANFQSELYLAVCVKVAGLFVVINCVALLASLMMTYRYSVQKLLQGVRE